MNQIITKEEAQNIIKPFLGSSVSRVWQGHGSAIFLEVGNLTENKGELTIMIEWSWRVEKGSKIEFGSWSEESDFSVHLQKLNGLILKNIHFESRLPEIVVELSDSTWVCSFSTVEGDPEWALITKEKTLFSSEANIVIE